MLNALQCAQNMATGNTNSAKYTNWVAGHRIVEPGTIEVAVGGASDNLPLSGSFTLAGSERAVGADLVLDTPVAIREVPGQAQTQKGRKLSRYSRRQNNPDPKPDFTVNSIVNPTMAVDSGF
jgi:hypothetical protein